MRFLVPVLVAVVFAVAAPTAGAFVWPPGGPNSASGGCMGSSPTSEVGGASTNGQAVCGATLAFIGPSIGQISNVMGPTIIGAAPVILAPVTTSNGSVQVAAGL